MIQPVIIQPDYSNAMVKGLQANLAYLAESKKGGGMRVSRGRGGGKSAVEKEKERFDKAQDARTKENETRNKEYKERQAEEDKANLLVEEKEKASEATRKEKFMEQLKSYAPAVTQGNYPDYLAFAKEGGIEFKGAATPDQTMQMQPDEFKSYMGGFFGDKKASGRSLSVKEQVMGKYISGDKMSDREAKLVGKELGDGKQVPGELNDNAVLLNLREIANYDQEKTAKLWDKYLGYTKTGMSRSDALNMVLKGDSNPALPASAGVTNYNYLWEK